MGSGSPREGPPDQREIPSRRKNRNDEKKRTQQIGSENKSWSAAVSTEGGAWLQFAPTCEGYCNEYHDANGEGDLEKMSGASDSDVDKMWIIDSCPQRNSENSP